MFAKSLALASIVSTTLAGSIPHIQSRSTLPDVTIKALPAGCASYPGYNADSQTAGPWSMIVSDAENPDLLRFGPSTSYSLSIGSQGPVMRWGYVNLGYRFGIARNAFQCIDNKLNILADTKVNAAGAPGDAKWTPTALSPYPYDAGLMYLIDGEQPTLYEHYIGEEKQDGWFLGGFNTSTWGVKWYEAESTSYFYPYFYMRLLPEDEGLQVNETRIFLKVQV
ncbi:hypothetical protein HBI44_132710 [Parastagonospora nodorum]|nr:hypothetical protein HBI44_132710 [Parastagonospora nodorum]